MIKNDALANIRHLHIVRGLAALLVVFFHAKYVFWVGGEIFTKEVGLHGPLDYFLFSLDMLSSCGKECVIIFFILSAFVIKHTSDHFSSNWIPFYKLRVIRIYLPFIFSMIFSIAVLFICIKFINPDIYTNTFRQYNSRLFAAANEFSVMQVVKTFLFIGNGEYAGANYAYWSLGHELIFYLLFPLYNLLKRNVLWITGLLLSGLFLITGYHIFYYQVFFVAGLLLYDYFSSFSKAPVLSNIKIYALLLVVFFLAVNLTNKLISEKFSDMVTLVYCFFIFDFILYHAKKPSVYLMRLADMSYTLYLNHLPLLLISYSFLTLYTGKLVFYNRLPYYGGALFALLAAIPLYLLIEKPSISLLKKLRKPSA